MRATKDNKKETRLRVRHKDGEFGYVEVTLTSVYCSVQFDRHKYYVVVKIDDLEPV